MCERCFLTGEWYMGKVIKTLYRSRTSRSIDACDALATEMLWVLMGAFRFPVVLPCKMMLKHIIFMHLGVRSSFAPRAIRAQ